MSVIARGTTKSVKIIYPIGCKEVTDELGKDELVRRLKLIARAFQDMGQDDNEQYEGLAIHVATDFFMEHTNKDVRLLVACCIADVFRVFAPEAPYRDASHIKDIFMFLIKQLRGLEDPNSPTFKRYFYLLENLAWVKSFNICIELDDNQEIFCSLFKLMFNVINEKHTTKVRTFMLDMMAPLLTEADIVSQELLDLLLINIVDPHKSQNRQAYVLASELLERTSNAIEPYVQTFFNNALMLGKTSESDLSEHLYELIYELNAISPSVLLAVLPQLEFKLKSNEESERKSVTKILSKMFSDPESNLAEQNKPLWNCFLGRFNDISITVRTVCVTSAVNFIQYHPELIKDVLEQVKIRQHDNEETVRQEVVSAMVSVSKKNQDILTDEMLDIIKERTRDKKFKIRRDALLGLGQLYKSVLADDEPSPEMVNKIVWVKDKVFHAYYQQNPEDKLLVERLFNICLVPYTLPASERMKKLYLLYATLDEPAVKAYHEMMKYRHAVRGCVKFILEGLDKMTINPAEQVAFLPKIHQIARTLPDPQKAMDQVKKFNEVLRDDRRLRSLMRYLISNECTCKKANDNVNEILRKLGGGGSNSSGAQLLLHKTVKSLLERVAPVMVDATAINLLVKHIDDAVAGRGSISDGIDRAGEKGLNLLLVLSSVFPQYFKEEDTIETLISFLKDEDEIVADTALQVFSNCGQDIETEFPELFAKLLPILQHTAKIGTPKQAKHAIRCINKITTNKEAVFSQVFEHVKNNINPDSANYITSIVALGHISQLCPQEFADSMKAIVSKDIVKDLLMADRTHGSQVMDSWYADHLVTEETNAKIHAMKLLVRWLLGLKSNLNNSGTSTLRLFYTVIVHEGDLMEKGLINKPELARLRLQAACCILKLCEENVFADLLQREQFQALALCINDSCWHVRLKFAAKLHRGLYSLKLPLEFMSIFSLAANDPLRERRTNIKKFIQMNTHRRRDYLKQNPGLGGRMFYYLPDYVMPYTVHLLAHDPDLKSFEDVQALKNIKECLWFIMEPLVARSEDYNYHFFRRLIENIKQAKDIQGPEDVDVNKKLYAVCDLALGLLQKNLTNIVLKDTNIDPVLPSKLFTKPDKSVLNSMIYLPKDFNFEKKKILSELPPPPPPPTVAAPTPGVGYYRGRRTEATLETIIVASPGPIVNRNPTCPREARVKKTNTNKVKSEEDGSKDRESSPDEVTVPTRKTVRGRGRKVVEETESDLADSEEALTEDMETSQDTSKDDGSSDVATPPPKKRLLKRTIGETQKSSQESSSNTKSKTIPAKKVIRKNSNASDSSEKDTTKTVAAKKTVKQTTKGQNAGKGVINGAGGKKGKGAKRTASEDVEDEATSEGESPSPKKKKFNLENIAVPAAKLGKKIATNKKKQVVQEEAESSSGPSSPDSSPSDSNHTSPTPSSTGGSFKSPGSPAPKATPKKKGGKAGAVTKTKAAPVTNKTRGGKLTPTSSSPASSAPSSPMASPRSSVTSTPSPSAKKAAVGKKGAASNATKSPKPVATATLKNVRRAKPLSNGTAGTGDTSPKKTAAAITRAIVKETNVKKAAASKGKGKNK